MKMLRCPFSILVLVLLLPGHSALCAQDFQPSDSIPPSPEKLKLITEKTAQLRKAIHLLAGQGLNDPWLADLEIFQRAAEAIVEHNEFFQKNYADWTLEVLDRGLFRTSFATRGEFPWVRSVGHAMVRGYRSRIDGSVQPYAVIYPQGYAQTPNLRYRVEIELHGRDKNLNEVKFLKQYSEATLASPEQKHIRLLIFGRVNNAYRWAGEIDVEEAFESFMTNEALLGRQNHLAVTQTLLRGFSMGGAGTWHLGLHRPDRWCAIQPGAGFTTTRGYVKNLKLEPWQEPCLHIYDAVDYAENAFNVPLVAYSGALDPQKQAADNIVARLQALKLAEHLQHIVAPGLKHTLPPDWRRKVDAALLPHLKKGRRLGAERVRFVTWTMRYARCDWVEILGLDRHYERALVDAKRGDNEFQVTTTNVQSLRLTLMPDAVAEQTVKIDGQVLTAQPGTDGGGGLSLYLRKKNGRWAVVLPQRLATERLRQPRKSGGMQGPIDDAFMDAFLCVRGTGNPWHESTGKYADAALERFRKEWSKYWRGNLPVKEDRDVTNQDIATRHLILFGDPASNSLLAQVLDGLPLTWSKEQIVLGGQTYGSAEHVPALIYPSPLNAARYVVLNSGHTFHEADYRGTNALLYPRLGDYAVLRLTGTDPLATTVATAGLFDEEWRLMKKSH